MEPDVCLQAGDFWCYETEWPVPMYWIAGNHERGKVIQDVLKGKHKLPRNSIMLKGGYVKEICGLKVLPLPAKNRVDAAPGPASFTRHAYECCWNHKGQDIDIFLSHGCGFEFVVNAFGRIINGEEEPITELIRRLKPKIAISGHCHTFANEFHEGIRCLRMGTCKPQGGGEYILTEQDFEED